MAALISRACARERGGLVTGRWQLGKQLWPLLGNASAPLDAGAGKRHTRPIMTTTNPFARIALVTGAAHRIGRAIALDLAANGWQVAVHYHHSEAAAQVVTGEIAAQGGRAAPVTANLADAAAIAGLIPACIAALGAPTCLINNASLFLPDEIGTIDDGLWDRHQAINLRAPVLLAQAFARHLPDGAEGNIINMIDQRVWKPTPLFFSYAIAKAGLYSATAMLAQALAPRIRVNAIGPGPAAASIHQTQEQFDEQCRNLPLEHGTTPGEIAATVRYLLSARAVTGQMIALDGGQHLAWRTPDVVADAGLGGLTSAAGGLPRPPAAREGLAVPLPLTRDGRHVLIQDLEILTMIGVHDAEKRAPQRVLVSIDLAVREEGPGDTDRLEDVLDYGDVVRRIERIVLAGHINLVETLAERIARDCLGDERVETVRVRIEKPDVIANARSVGVEILRARAKG